jgi:hypothetical protein
VRGNESSFVVKRSLLKGLEMVLGDPGIETVFVVTDKHVDLVPIIVLGSVFFLSILCSRVRTRVWPVPLRWFCLASATVTALLIFLVCSRIYLPEFTALHEYRNGNFSVVEGYVTDFQPLPSGGHGLECFTVSIQRFCYSDFHGAPGFNRTSLYGGPMRAGLLVRISHHDQAILKIDVIHEASSGAIGDR